MRTSKLSQLKLTLLLSLCIPALSGCESVQIKNRLACAVNGSISLGSTCAETVTSKPSQLSMDQTLEMIEAQPNHPPAVFQSAADYGEETTELEVACRILGNDCTYELQNTIKTRKALLEKMKDLK